MTTKVKTVAWFSAVLFMSKAVVYLSQREVCAETTLAPATTAARGAKNFILVGVE